MSRNRRDDRRRRDPPAIAGPTPEDIQEAFDELLTDDPTELPPYRAIETLQEANIGFPLTVGNRRILDVGVTEGNPMNGALRSDDHIGLFEVEYAEDCPEEDCYSEVTRFEYNAHHHIAGSLKKYCPRCETVHHSDQWG